MGVFFLAGWACLQPGANLKRWPPALWAALGIGLFGFFQLAVGTTVYRWATLQAALSNLALAASALAAYLVFAKGSVRAAFLGSFRGFGLILSVISVLSYWTSPGKILWIFPAIYPDNWGPFPSRNNFAQFLELSFPVALWEMGRRRREGQPREEAGGWTAAVAPAVMLGAGLASASRAGAALLVAEGAAGLLLLRRRKGALRKPALTLALASTVFASVAGAGVLLRRFEDRDPLRIRREIFHSTAAMLEALPVRLKAQPSRLEAQPSRWSGYGLGTFASVYPQFAEFDSGANVEHAHNDWLEWLAEGGPLYAGAWALLAVWALRPALRSVWGLGVVAVFVHAAVDYPFARLGISAWAFVLLGLLARESEKTAGPDLLRKGSQR